MAKGTDLGPRSRVDPAGRMPTRTPRTGHNTPGFRARETRACSPHGFPQRYRRSRRGGR
jgi:hypothetical protein